MTECSGGSCSVGSSLRRKSSSSTQSSSGGGGGDSGICSDGRKG